jgi:hypothetical protein
LVNNSTVTAESVLHFCIVTIQRPTVESPYSPISQILDAFLTVSLERQRSWPSERTTNSQPHQWRWCSTAADSRVVKCNRSSHQQVIHILPQRKHVNTCLTIL